MSTFKENASYVNDIRAAPSVATLDSASKVVSRSSQLDSASKVVSRSQVDSASSKVVSRSQVALFSSVREVDKIVESLPNAG
jgi:hypothetical protein